MIEILRIVGELPPGATIPGRRSQWAVLAGQLPTDGAWCQITPKPVPAKAKCVEYGIEITTRKEEMYARRSPKPQGQTEPVKAPKKPEDVIGAILNPPTAAIAVEPSKESWATMTKRERPVKFVAAWRAFNGDIRKVADTLDTTDSVVQAISKQLRTQGLL